MGLKIYAGGVSGKDRKTAMCECVNGRKKKKARLVLDSFLNFRRLLMAACPAWWAFRFLRKGQARRHNNYPRSGTK